MRLTLNYKATLLLAALLLCGINLKGQQCNSSCQDLVSNGDFSQGDTAFTSDLLYDSSCNSGSYSIETSATDKCNNSLWNPIPDHTTGSGNYMVVDGRASTYIWEQTVNVTAGETYEFNYWAYPNVSDGTGPILEFRVNGNIQDSIDLSNFSDSWTEICHDWMATMTGPVTIQIFQVNSPFRSDYGLDDISLRPEICEVDPCEVEIDFNFDVELCRVDFSGTSVNVPAPLQVLSTTWTFGDGHSSNELNPVHFYDQTGVFNACLTVVTYNPETNECCVTEECIEVSVREPCERGCSLEEINWEASVDECCNYTFTAQANPQANVIGWSWDFGDGTQGNGNPVNHSFPGPGSYNVCVTAVAETDEGCCVRTFCNEIRVECESDSRGKNATNSGKSLNSENLKVYPNPSSGMINVKYNIDKAKNVDVSIFDLQGRKIKKVRENSLQSSGSYDLEVSTSSFSEGIYLLKITKGEDQEIRKIIIQE